MKRTKSDTWILVDGFKQLWAMGLDAITIHLVIMIICSHGIALAIRLAIFTAKEISQ